MTTASRMKDIANAELLFKKVIFAQRMNKCNIKGWEKDIILPYLVDPQAWLGVWMLRSDEISQTLLGKRLWNVAYQADKECMEGMKPVPITEDIFELPNIDTYLKYPVLESHEVNDGLKFMISQAAFLDSITLEGNEVSIKTLYSFGYELEKPLEHGDFLPCVNTDILLAKQMNSFEIEINNKQTLSNDLSREQTI